MDNENKGFPNGWGDNSEDAEDYGFVDDTDEDDEYSAWGNSSSPFKKNEPVTSPETNNKTSTQSESVTPNTSNESNNDSVYDAPVQNFEQPESISSPAPTLNVSPNQGYVMQKQKTNPVLIIVIIVLVLVIGVLGCMFFMMIKDKKSGTSDEFSAVSDAVETTAEITEAPTESKTKTTTAAATTPVESTTQTTSSIPDQYSSEEISAMFSAYIAENPDPNRNYENADYGYALIDLNNDGVQELLITYDEVEAGSPGVTGIFNINNNSLESIWISDFRTLGKLCEDNYIYTSAIYGQGYGIFIYKYFSAGSFENIESIEYNASIGSDKALHNGSEVSQIEAEEILAKYNAKKFKTKPLIVNIQPTTSVPTETYAFYGIVATESGTLNLRDKPSTDSNVIKELSKGTKGSIYYIDGYSDWYKMYTDDGQSGYVSAQYIKEYNESSNNNTPYVSGTQTPWGTFTYSNFSESDYDSYTIYDPASVGIYLNCDIDSFNSNHSDYRIDNIAFWIVKHSTENKPHNYDMGITIMGTVLSKNERNINIEAYLINESTGEKIGGNVEMRLEANLYSGETFCFDSISYNMWETFRDIWDNSSYTLVLE